MDLRDIEAWGRELLEHEAAKRGIRSPEVYSRTDLVRLILKHDYGAPRNVKEAARLIGGIFGSAKEVLKKRLNPLQAPGVRTYPGAAKEAAWKPEAPARSADVRTLDSARARDVAEAKARSESSPAPLDPGGIETSEILERSYVGDRNLELPTLDASNTSTAASAASSSGTPDIENSYVSGRKLDLSVTDNSHEDEQVRADARDVRKESERVRSDSRAAGQAEVARPEPGWHRVRLGRDLPPTAAKSDVRPEGAAASRGDAPLRIAETKDAASQTPSTAGDAPVPRLRLVEPLPRSNDEVQATPAEPVAEAPRAPEPMEQLAYGPHPQDGLLLRWRVTDDAIDRARRLLGTKGELAVRIVAVRVEPHAVVKTDVIDHGPIAATGDWTAPLLPTEAKYVSSIGLRSANKFISIVHAKS